MYNRHSPLHAALICPALPPIPNGAIAYDPDVTAPYEVDTVATHTCDPGFRLSGSETRQCLAGGIWSNLVPVCLGTYKIRLVLRKLLILLSCATVMDLRIADYACT